MHRRDVPIARPCDAVWEEMEGDAFRRFCRSCHKHVHDLSALDELEARRLLDAAGSVSLCVQYRTDATGRLLFHEPPPVALRRSRRGAVIAAGLAGSLAAACAAPVDGDTTDASFFEPDAGLADPTDDLSAFGFAGAPSVDDTEWPAPTPVVRVPIPELGDDFFVRRPVITHPPPASDDDDPGVFGLKGDVAVPLRLGRVASPILRGKVVVERRVDEVRATMGEPMWVPDETDDADDTDD